MLSELYKQWDSLTPIEMLTRGSKHAAAQFNDIPVCKRPYNRGHYENCIPAELKGLRVDRKSHADGDRQFVKLLGAVLDAMVAAGDRCTICLQDYETGEAIKTLPCSHPFHCACIERWLGDCRGSCPLCTQKVVLPPVPPLPSAAAAAAVAGKSSRGGGGGSNRRV